MKGLSRAAVPKHGSAIVLYGVEGVGKTSLAAHRPDVAFILAPQETGYLTLRQNNLVPDCPIIQPESWTELLAEIDALIADPQGVGMLALDALGGLERLCHEHVCQTEFDGVWGEKGFLSYHKGYEMAVGEWLKLLGRLDVFRFKHAISVMMLAHAKIGTFKNPTGADYDRYSCDCHAKTWGVTSKWSDAVLFGNFVDLVDEKKGQRKGIGGRQRVLYTERSAVFDAKNRFGLSSEIDIPNDHTQGYAALAAAMIRKGQ